MYGRILSRIDQNILQNIPIQTLPDFISTRAYQNQTQLLTVEVITLTS